MIATKWSEARLAELRADPVKFAINVLQFDGVGNPQLTEDQFNLLEDLRDNNPARIAVKGGQGTLKTTTGVIVALWRAFQDKNALVVVTAPTQAQLKDVWMAELRKVLNNAHPEFRKIVCLPVPTLACSYGGGEFGRIMMRSSSKPECFAGYCNPHLTFIIDEASGVSRNVFHTIRGSATNAGSLILAMGSPNTRDCTFFELFSSKLWTHRTWSSENGSNPESASWIEQEYGRDSDMYRIRVLGEFPTG